MYHYKLKSMNKGSETYGNCEVCGKPVSEVFYQVESRDYTGINGVEHITHHDCKSIFGHEKCLIDARKSN